MILAGLAASTVATTGLPTRSLVRQHVEGYAIATCLAATDNPYLRRQGQGWLSVIIERGHGPIEPYAPLRAVVLKTAKDQPEAIIHGDGGPDGDYPAPVYRCGTIIDTPAVRAVIERTIRRLAPAYRRG